MKNAAGCGRRRSLNGVSVYNFTPVAPSGFDSKSKSEGPVYARVAELVDAGALDAPGIPLPEPCEFESRHGHVICQVKPLNLMEDSGT